jgi:hypothetical protein
VFRLTKSEIRLQYSGFAIFAAKLVSVGTGFFFQFMLARALLGNLSLQSQYNIWFNVNDVIAYFTLLMGVVPFWVMRYVARGKEGAIKTGLATNLVVAAICTVSYLALAPSILSLLGITADFLPLYFVASIQIVELYTITIFESCLQAYKPQAVGYGLLIQQVSKTALGYVLIVQFGLPLLGAVVSVFVGFAVQVVYYYGLLYDELKAKIQWGYVKDWLKGSAATIYNVVGSQIAAFVFLMLYNYGSNADPTRVGGRGYYGAAAQIANIITYSSFLAFALYPKLLAERKREDITISLKMVLMFAVPMTVGAAALADSYMALLSPEIRDAYLVLVVLAADALVLVVSGIFGSVLFGVETVDQEEMSFRKLVKSRMFLAFSLPYLQAAITLPTAYYVLTTHALNQPLEAALYVSVINAIARFLTFIILYAIVRKMVKVDIPWRSISKYVFASAVMGAVAFLLPHPTRISTTLIMTAAAAGIYLALLMAIDKEARALPKAVVQELRAKTNSKKQQLARQS